MIDVVPHLLTLQHAHQRDQSPDGCPTMGNLDSEINSMKSTVTGNNAAMTAYMDSLSSALNNLGEIGNDTISRMMESIRQNTENAANNINGKLNDMKDILTEKFLRERQRVGK